MPGLSRLILADADDQTRAAVRFAFEREGVAVDVVDSADRLGELVNGASQLLIVGDRVADQDGTKILERLRQGSAMPALFLGGATQRSAALGAGATQFLARPAFARDVVTMGRLLAGRKDQPGPQTFSSELGELYGLYYVIRALAAARWRGVLTLVRGLRRGELRLYDGEVTSAQVGVLHGLGALHQLLLWTSARMELRVEDVVRRRQIPLEPDEILADAERFLSEMRRAGQGLSPAAVYAQDGRKAAQLPELVAPVVRLFDGNRSLADVVEDSPFRVAETLRAASRLAEIGAIRELSGGASPRSGGRAALALEEWLVGRAPAAAPVTAPAESSRTGSPSAQPAAPPQGKSRRNKGKQRRRRQSDRTSAPPPAHDAAASLPATDWSAILPSAIAGELPGYAAVVPSVNSAGEITGAGARAPSEAAQLELERERLEEITDTAARSRLFGDGDEVTPVDVPDRIHDVDTAKLRRELQAAAEDSGAVSTGAVAGELIARAEPRETPVEQGDSIVVSDSMPVATVSSPSSSDEPVAPRQRERVAEEFSDAEEAFFREGVELSHKLEADASESFDDLETEQPKTFWQRLIAPKK